MRIGLFSYHANFATSEYLLRAIERDGHECIRLGIQHPNNSRDPSPDLEEFLGGRAIDLLLFVDPPGPIWPRSMERICCPTVAYLIDVHQNFEVRAEYAAFFDFIFVAQKDYVGRLTDLGFDQVIWLPLACDPSIHTVAAEKRDIEVGFVGKLGPNESPRFKVLTEVLANFGTNEIDRFISPDVMGAIYGRSKIVFNKSINGDLNMRVFEAMASGALLVTDRIDNGMEELFADGVHYVSYTTAGEAIAKIRYFLRHDKERVAIARNGHALVLQHHTYLHRWKALQLLVLEGPKRCARIRQLSALERVVACARVYESLRQPEGIIRLAQQGGPRLFLAGYLFRALARNINARFPITPNALRARFPMKRRPK